MVVVNVVFLSLQNVFNYYFMDTSQPIRELLRQYLRLKDIEKEYNEYESGSSDVYEMVQRYEFEQPVELKELERLKEAMNSSIRASERRDQLDDDIRRIGKEIKLYLLPHKNIVFTTEIEPPRKFDDVECIRIYFALIDHDLPPSYQIFQDYMDVEDIIKDKQMLHKYELKVSRAKFKIKNPKR